MKCPKCGSEEVSFIGDTKSENRGCASWFFWIVLAFFTCGLSLIFWLIMLATNKKTKTDTRCVCNNCGHQWRL
ncbi:MAG: LITAF-like zinc ribbon domain-containing protein [Clostridia bacterium]|nr:LITAF-like zinc ribbon domain-containing protein [Clostridia bacterium]